MDKSILIEYAEMKEEIKDLRRRIEKGRKELDKLNNMIVADVVSCGKKGKKALQMVKIEGKPTVAIDRKEKAYKRNIALLENQELELLELTNQTEEYIETIDKSELRIMFRLYYVDDLTWFQVALHMNSIFPKRRIKFTDDNCRVRHDRYLEKVL